MARTKKAAKAEKPARKPMTDGEMVDMVFAQESAKEKRRLKARRAQPKPREREPKAVGPAPEPSHDPAPEPKAPRSPMVENPVRTAEDTRTHIERINPGDNPAYIPGAWPQAEKAPAAPDGDPLGIKRRYRMLQTGIHNGVRLVAGSVVELYDHEVGAHHELIPEDVHRVPNRTEEPDRVHRHSLQSAETSEAASEATRLKRQRKRG